MSWERELAVLDAAIRRLNAEYDAFLFGSQARPPVESQRRVEEMFRRLGSAQTDLADRYRLSTLQGRYSSLCERWEKLQAEKEAGRRPGVRGGFRAEVGSEGSGRAARAGSPPNTAAASSVQADRGTGASRDRELFERYIGAKRDRGEEISGYRLDSFLDRLEEERGKLREHLGAGEADFEFEVAERNGRVKLVARRRSRKGA